MRVLIIGCGWAGALLAYELRRRHPSLDVIIVEPFKEVGGLLRSEFISGFTIDVGGSHVIFSRRRDVLDGILNFLGGNYVKHFRDSYVLLGSHLVPYPFENGLYVLPPEVRAEALISFVESMISRDQSWMPRNFLEWVYGAFGKWIADNYLIPYNLKIWKRPLDDLSADWVFTPGRLPIPNWRDVVRSAVGIRTEGYLEQAEFYYPLVGGIQALHKSVTKLAIDLGVKILTNFRLDGIRKVGNEFVVNNELRSDKVVNTMPLPELIKALDPPTEVVKAASQLDYNPVLVTAIALRREAPKHHWIYVPKSDVVFHRYAWISNYSPYNSPKNSSLLIAEATLKPDEEPNADRLTHKVVEDLMRLDVVKGNDVIFIKSWIHKYGYPIYRLNHVRVRGTILGWLEDLGIKSVGRWGSWHYWNIDRVYEEVIKLISSGI
mgnify:CR=1 FL=1